MWSGWLGVGVTHSGRGMSCQLGTSQDNSPCFENVQHLSHVINL